MGGRDLRIFDEDNRKWRAEGKRVPYHERVELIDEHFPSARNADWNVILRDPDILGRLLRDILKVDQIEPGRAGPRPNLDYERGMQSWREMTGQDFAELPFAQAFRGLTRGHSYSMIANKTRLSRSKVYRLIQGDDLPTIDEIKAVAAAYGKKPSFFAEYRAEYVMAAIGARLLEEHEMTTALYRKLVRS